MVESLQQLASYPWSSHAMLTSEVKYDWIDRDYVLRHFGQTDGAARTAYVEYLEQEPGIDRKTSCQVEAWCLRKEGGRKSGTWGKEAARRYNRAIAMLERIARATPSAFVHRKSGYIPKGWIPGAG
jgi:hypothetical protein